MEIKLHNLALFPQMSRETYCYTANVWINGRRAFISTNQGNGGPDRWERFNNTEKLIADAEEWAKQQPSLCVCSITVPMTLELYVSLLVENSPEARAMQ